MLFAIISLILSHCIQLNKLSENQKYSYHIVGLVDNKPLIGGTCFFVKHHEKYFLVSAWHSFTFKNHITEEYENPLAVNINKIIVYRNVKDIGQNEYLMIPLTNGKVAGLFEKRVNDTLLDIGAIQVDRQKSYPFNYINLKDEGNAISPGELVEYNGFPVLNGKQQDTSFYFTGKVVDLDLKRKEYTIKINGFIGCSGSPVFKLEGERATLGGVLFYALKDKTGKAEFCKTVDISWLRSMLYRQ